MRNTFFSLMAISAITTFISLQNAFFARQAQAIAIRDAEIEHTIRSYAAPLLRAAGTNINEVRIHILNNKAINAFVAKGQRIYITSGLILATKEPLQLIGVIAHEIGHITGGHIARMVQARKIAKDLMLFGQFFGMAAGVLSKNTNVAVATSATSSEIAHKGFLRFSRVQERAADQVAINLLEKTQTSALGLLSFFKLLKDQELLARARQDAYVITHPATQDRISFVENHVLKSAYTNKDLSADLKQAHARTLAKLGAFIDPPATTLLNRAKASLSINDKYALAIANFRNSKINKAIGMVNGLIEESPEDPYFHELKGQMLFEHGKIKEALHSYQKAVRLQPFEPLLRIGLAHAQLESKQSNLWFSAINNLELALRRENSFPFAWKLAGIAYGKVGRIGMSALALAEHNNLLGRYSEAQIKAKKALKSFPKNTPGWIRAQDLFISANRSQKRTTR